MRKALLILILMPGFAYAGKYNLTDQERTCLYLNAFFEGAVDTIPAHQGFIEVVLNRRASKEYPNDACQVIYQSDAFSWTITRGQNFEWAKRDRWVNENEKHVLQLIQIVVDSIVDAFEAGELKPITYGATHYHADYVEPCWLPDMKLTNKLGYHLYYKEVQKTGACAKAVATNE